MHQREELLLLVRHAGRQGDNMPMKVGVALLAAKAQDEDAFGGNRQRQCSADGTDQGQRRRYRRSVEPKFWEQRGPLVGRYLLEASGGVDDCVSWGAAEDADRAARIR